MCLGHVPAGWASTGMNSGLSNSVTLKPRTLRPLSLRLGPCCVAGAGHDDLFTVMLTRNLTHNLTRSLTLAVRGSGSRGRKPLGPMPPFEGTLQETRDTLYGRAQRGMLPISWGSLGHGIPRPIETLALEQHNANEEYRRARKLDIILRPERGGRCTPEYAKVRRTYLKARVCRMEKARHYGVLVCRAFFQTATVSQGMPDFVRSRAYVPEIVKLVEEFLNG